MGEGKTIIEDGQAVLGIEFGSTRIKAVLISKQGTVLEQGSFEWENHLADGIWTYGWDEIISGLQSCYQDLKANVTKHYDVGIKRLAAIGISGMMHGYLVFDKEGKPLVPFRTWRNTITGEAAGLLTKEFSYNIPQRWSIAHLYQAILNGEEHVSEIAYITTLAGYIHWLLTGEKVIGVGEASGMFPIDAGSGSYKQEMLERFGELSKEAMQRQGKNCPWEISDILPKVLTAGERAGTLTEEGAALLDSSGELETGIPMCPPEGDAGTGMVATNSVAVRTGNVSAGTSIFSMVVLEKELQNVHEEIDLVCTPDGHTVAMVHCNNCTSDINGWVSLFEEFGQLMGMTVDRADMYEKLFRKALEGAADGGGLLSYNYVSGEPVTGLQKGRPLFVRKPDAAFSLADFMRVQLYSALAAIKIGNDILLCEEGVAIDKIYGHGGFFKTKGVGQKMMAAALDTPVSVMETAGEGGAWGIALLAAFMMSGRKDLAGYLEEKIFAGESGESIEPCREDVEGFKQFLEEYKAGLGIESAAVELY